MTYQNLKKKNIKDVYVFLKYHLIFKKCSINCDRKERNTRREKSDVDRIQ